MRTSDFYSIYFSAQFGSYCVTDKVTEYSVNDFPTHPKLLVPAVSPSSLSVVYCGGAVAISAPISNTTWWYSKNRCPFTPHVLCIGKSSVQGKEKNCCMQFIFVEAIRLEEKTTFSCAWRDPSHPFPAPHKKRIYFGLVFDIKLNLHFRARLLANQTRSPTNDVRRLGWARPKSKKVQFRWGNMRKKTPMIAGKGNLFDYLTKRHKSLFMSWTF